MPLAENGIKKIRQQTLSVIWSFYVWTRQQTDYPTHILLNVFLKSADYKPSAPMPFY